MTANTFSNTTDASNHTCKTMVKCNCSIVLTMITDKNVVVDIYKFLKLKFHNFKHSINAYYNFPTYLKC